MRFRALRDHIGGALRGQSCVVLATVHAIGPAVGVCCASCRSPCDAAHCRTSTLGRRSGLRNGAPVAQTAFCATTAPIRATASPAPPPAGQRPFAEFGDRLETTRHWSCACWYQCCSCCLHPGRYAARHRLHPRFIADGGRRPRAHAPGRGGRGGPDLPSPAPGALVDTGAHEDVDGGVSHAHGLAHEVIGAVARPQSSSMSSYRLFQ